MGELGRSERLGSGATPPARARKKTVGVTPLTRKTKEVYQIAFSYRGVECREVVALPHSKANETYCVRLRAEILGRITRNDFKYGDYFPESQRVATFGERARNKPTTIEQILLSYLERVKPTVEATTYRVYQNDVMNIVIPAFGRFGVDALTRRDVRDWVSKQELSYKRVKNLLLPLRSALSDAVDDELIEVSPLDGFQALKYVPLATRTTDYEPEPYTEQEIATLLANLPETDRSTFQLWAYTGMRTSELIGLNWNRASLERNEIHIVEVNVHGRDKANPKTPHSVRRIPLMPAAREALEILHNYRGKVKGDRVAPNLRALKNNPDPKWDYGLLSDSWKRAHAGTGIKCRSPYQLRHTFASQLLSQGENPSRIASLLGHGGPSMVLQVYGKWIEQGEDLSTGARPVRAYGMNRMRIPCDSCEERASPETGQGPSEGGCTTGSEEAQRVRRVADQ
jgi:integrase